jgi:hypothetical protein
MLFCQLHCHISAIEKRTVAWAGNDDDLPPATNQQLSEQTEADLFVRLLINDNVPTEKLRDVEYNKSVVYNRLEEAAVVTHFKILFRRPSRMIENKHKQTHYEIKCLV